MAEDLLAQILRPPHAQESEFLVNPTYLDLDVGDHGAYAAYSGRPSKEEFKGKLHERMSEKWPTLKQVNHAYHTEFSVVCENEDLLIVVSSLNKQDISVSLVPLQGAVSQRDALEFDLIVRSEWPKHHLEKADKPGEYSRAVSP